MFVSYIAPRVDYSGIKRYTKQKVERKIPVNGTDFPYRYEPGVAEKQWSEYDAKGRRKKLEETGNHLDERI